MYNMYVGTHVYSMNKLEYKNPIYSLKAKGYTFYQKYTRKKNQPAPPE